VRLTVWWLGEVDFVAFGADCRDGGLESSWLRCAQTVPYSEAPVASAGKEWRDDGPDSVLAALRPDTSSALAVEKLPRPLARPLQNVDFEVPIPATIELRLIVPQHLASITFCLE
jgi:hypothetical protein